MNHTARRGRAAPTGARLPAWGFSLIELMVVVAVIGILAGIGFPSYQDYVRRSHRSSAEQVIMEIVSKQSLYILDARQYATIMGVGGLNLASRDDGWTCTAIATAPQCSNSYYTLAVTVDNAATPPTFSMLATAIGNQVADGNLTYGSTGTKTRLVGGVDKGW